MATTSVSGSTSIMKALDGSTYRLPAYVYPRYAYFQQRIQLFEKYLKKIQKKSKFQDSISQGEEKLTDLYERLKMLQSSVNVSLFCEDLTLLISIEKIFLAKQLEGDDQWKKESVSLADCIKRTKSMDLLEVIVLVFDEVDVKLLQDLNSLCQNMTEDQKSLCLLYYTKESRSFSLTDLESANFSPASLGEGKTKLTLAQHVQYSLEARVVDTLEWMSNIMDEVLPHPGERQEQNMSAFVCNDFFIWYENEHVLEDLSPVPKSPDSVYTTPQTSEKSEELDELFRAKMLVYLAQKTRCRCCEHIGKAYGLKEAVMNHYMQDVFSFEEKLKTAFRKLNLPTYDDLKQSRQYMFRSFSLSATTDVRHLIGGVEKMLGSLLAILEKMRRLKYLVNGLLRLTNVEMINKVPDIPKLPREMQLELLKLPFVTGCGTIFGRLTIHVSSELSIPQQKEVEELVVKLYRYNFPYKIEVLNPRKINQAGGKEIEQGSLVQAEKQQYEKGANPYEYSSLGCFVDVTFSEMEKKLHFVTCNHCVKDCKETVSVKNPHIPEPVTLGTVSGYCNRQIDVALVEVKKDKYKQVSKNLRKSDIGTFKQWSFFDPNEQLIARHVYKIGAATSTRHGIISSLDYLCPEELSEEVQDLVDSPYFILIAPESAIDVSSNSRVVPDEDEPMDQGEGAAADGRTDEEKRVFSEKGDSGASVCDSSPDTGDGVVIALLQGALDDGNRYWCSYGRLMKSALELLKSENSNIHSIEPANEAGLP